MPREIKIAGALFFFACAAVCFLSFSSSIGKIYTLDETQPALRAHMILAEGLTGPAKAMGGEAFTHPPLYEAVLVLLFRLFGESDVTGRAFGIVGYAATAIFLLLLIRRLSRDKGTGFFGIASFIFLCFYLTSPLLIQHSMLIDSETALVGPIATAFITFFVCAETWNGRRYWMSRLGLGALIALAFFAKEVTPFLLVLGVFVYRVVAWQWKKLWIDAAGILLFGVGLIVLTSMAYTALSGQNVEIFLTKQYGFRTARVLSTAFFLRVMKNLSVIARWPLFWATGPLHLMALYGLWARLKSRFWDRKNEIVDYVWIAGLVIWVPYLLVKPSIDMMKFQNAVYPWLMAVIALNAAGAALSLEKEHSRESARWYGRILTAAVLVFSTWSVYYYFRGGDYILSLALPKDSKIWRDFLFFYWKPVAAVLLFAPVLFFKIKKMALYALLFALTVSMSIALDLRQRSPYTTVESWLNYGETGMRQAVDYLASRDLNGKALSVRSDIYYYLKYRQGIFVRENMETSNLFSMKNPQDRILRIRDAKLDYIVIDNVSRVYVRMDSPLGDLIQKFYRVDKQFGDFKILVPKTRAGSG